MIEVIRSFDASFINEVLNDPDVRPDVAEQSAGRIDISKAVADTDNVLLIGEHGGTFLFKLMPGLYEVHTQVKAGGRGAWIVDFVRAGARWMFTHTDCFEIVTRVPINHHAARSLTLMAGMRREFTRHDECYWRGDKQDVEAYSWRIQDWIVKTPELEERGEAFHEFLHSEAKRLGIADQPHPNDPQHNRYVGAALEMLQGDQLAKAINFYNRWALMARHPIITLQSVKPVTVRFDIGDLIVENGAMRVVPMDKAA